MNFCDKCGSGVVVLTFGSRTIQVCSEASFNIVKKVLNIDSKYGDDTTIAEIKRIELEGHFFKEGV